MLRIYLNLTSTFPKGHRSLVTEDEVHENAFKCMPPRDKVTGDAVYSSLLKSHHVMESSRIVPEEFGFFRTVTGRTDEKITQKV